MDGFLTRLIRAFIYSKYPTRLVFSMKNKILLSDFNIELQTLLLATEAAFSIEKKAALTTFLSTHKVDWEKTYRLAQVHQIRPVFLRGITGLPEGFIPSNIVKQLKQDCQKIAFHNLRQTSELIRLLGLFKRANVPTIPYKGVWLANAYYDDFGMREFSDIDLFIHKKDLPAIENIMISENYIPEFSMTENQKDKLLAIYCEYNFNLFNHQNQRLFHVEPHYASNHRYWCINLSLKDFENNITQAQLSNHSIDVLSPEDNLILTLTNHGVNEGWTKLKYIIDLNQIMKKHPSELNWDYIIKTTKQLDIELHLYTGLAIIRFLFAIILPDKLNALIDTHQNMYSERLLSLEKYHGITPRTQLRRVLYNMKCRTKSATKLKMILYQINSPCKADMEFIILPKSLFFLYAIMRPIRIANDTVHSYFVRKSSQ